jgi:tetratricopeptide (TPR) repeat protein
MSDNPLKFADQAVPAMLVALLLIAGCGRSGESNLETGIARLKAGDYNAAAGMLEKASIQMPDNASARCNLGITYWKLGRHKESIFCFKKASQLCPDDIRPLEFMAAVIMEMQNWNEARGILIQADKRQPSTPRILTAIALVEFRSGNNAQALSRLTQAIEIDPTYATALYNMAVLQRDRLNNKEAAINYFQNYIKVAGGDSRIRDVPQFLKKVPPARPPSETVKQPQADPLVTNAKKAIDAQEFDSALEMLKQAIRKNPTDPSATWELAVLYDKHLKYNDKAADLYRKFLQQFPNDARAAAARKRVGEILSTAKKQPVQKEDSKPAQPARDPETAQAAFQEGLNYQTDQKWDNAIASYKRAFELDNSLAVAAYNLGLTYKSKGDLTMAKQAFVQALAIEPNMTKAHYMMAVINNSQKENKQAIEQLNSIFRVDPDYAKAHLLMGVILKEENNLSGAKTHLEKYMKLTPDDQSVKIAQELLNSIKDQQQSER